MLMLVYGSLAEAALLSYERNADHTNFNRGSCPVFTAA
jgi:hypothetical protein